MTTRLAFAAAAILVVTGCTTESSTEGCGVAASGFTGTAKSELGEGTFDYADKTPASKYPGPAAVAKGGEFSLTYRRYTDDGTPLALRSASSDKLVGLASGEEEGTVNVPFRALTPGVVAVLAVSTKDAHQIVDLLHVRVLEPAKLRFSVPYDLDEDLEPALQKGTIRIPKGSSAQVIAEVLGEIDEANGALAEHAVGELVLLGGIKPKWETTDAEVVDFEPERDGSVRARANGIGTADVTVSAGAVSRVVHVTVTPGGY